MRCKEIFRSRNQKMAKLSLRFDAILAMLSLLWKQQGYIAILHLKIRTRSVSATKNAQHSSTLTIFRLCIIYLCTNIFTNGHVYFTFLTVSVQMIFIRGQKVEHNRYKLRKREISFCWQWWEGVENYF